MIDHGKIPSFPKITAKVTSDGTGEVTVNGISQTVKGKEINELRSRIIAVISATADKIGRPVKVLTTDPDGVWPLVVHPDGTVEQDSSATPPETSKTPDPSPKFAPPKNTTPTLPPSPPSPHHESTSMQTKNQDDIARLKAHLRSVQLWEEVINENNQRRGYLQKVTLAKPSYPLLDSEVYENQEGTPGHLP